MLDGSSVRRKQAINRRAERAEKASSGVGGAVRVRCDARPSLAPVGEREGVDDRLGRMYPRVADCEEGGREEGWC